MIATRYKFSFLISLTLSSCGFQPSGSFLREEAEASITLIARIPGGVHGIAVNSADDFFYSDSFGNQAASRKIYRINKPYTSPATALGISGVLPAGLEFSGSQLMSADTGGNIVKIYNDDFTGVDSYPAAEPWNVTLGSDGSLVSVSNKGTVEKLRKNNSPVLLFSGLDAPFDVVATADGNFWISEQGAQGEGWVTLRSEEGLESKRIGPLDNPEGLVLDQDGNLWIADTGVDRIYRYTTSTDELKLVTSNIAFPIAGVQTHSGMIVFNGLVNGIYGLYRVD